MKFGGWPGFGETVSLIVCHGPARRTVARSSVKRLGLTLGKTMAHSA